MLLPYAISAPAFTILSWLGMTNDPIALLVGPRAIMTGLSILVDMLVYHIACMLHLDTDAVMWVYTTSYITMVYHTRTLSNSLEAFLFVALVFCVVHSTKHRSMTEQRKNRSKLTRATKESLRMNPEGIDEIWDIKYNTFVISFILVSGFFNRPTFLAFACVPFLYWLISGNTEFIKDRFAMFAIIKKSLHISTLMWGVVWCFIIFDSMYYREFSFDMMDDSGIWVAVENFLVVTPGNFIAYNMQTKNLAEHTLHPSYIHFAVNTQLLFGFLGIFALITFVKIITNIRKIFSNKDVTWKGFLVLSYIVPILLLSIFPHQEPRFLIPLLLPLALLYSHHIFGILANKKLTVLWIIFNCICALFYGALHQGGLVPAISNIKQQFPDSKHSIQHPAQQYVIFYNTYMPPRHLFANSWTDVRNSIVIHDLKGADPSQLYTLVEKIDHYSSGPYQISLVSPRTSEHKFCGTEVENNLKKLSFRLYHQFSLHISTENLPTGRNFRDMWNGELKCTTCGDKDSCDNGSLFAQFHSLFALNLYQVKLYGS